MLTIFTIPKSFKDRHISIIQNNAIKSWKALKPKCQIILIGSDPGVKEVARKLHIEHRPKVQVNNLGTPILSSAFKIVRKYALNDTLLYVNADIILTQSIIYIQKYLPKRDYLVVGERYDLNVQKAIDFGNPSWCNEIENALYQNGTKHARHGSDYFIFSKKNFTNIPDFAVGRVGWDNWMIGEALDRGYKVIDASPAVKAVHQNHDYIHQKNRGKSRYTSKEAVINKELAGGKLKWLESANYVLTKNGLRKKMINIELIYNNLIRWLAKLK